jgi:hypothetical protein
VALSGLNQSELSRRTGIARQDIAAAINGTRPLFPSWRRRLADALGTDPAAL